jgi:two-component system, NarL family, sensor kinase
MRKIFYVLLLLLSERAFAVRPVLDSLEKKAMFFVAQQPSFGRDTMLISALWELTYYSTYFREKNTKLLLDSLERFSNRTNWQAGKGMFLIDKSFYLSNYLSDYANGLLEVLRAKEILKNTKSHKALAYANLRISSILLWNLNNGKNEKFSQDGIKVSKEMIALGEKINDFDIQCQGLIYAANHYNFIGDSANAHKNLEQVHEIIEQHRVSYLAENVFYGTYGVYFSYTNQIEKALEYWNKCLKIATPQSDFYTLTSMNRLKADYYFMYAPKKDLTLALSFAQESYKYAQQLGILKYISIAERDIYLINRMIGNNDEALKYFELHWTHEDSLSRERIQKTYADYELLQKESQIKTLENERLQKENERHDLVRNLLVISLITGIGLAFYFFRNNQQLKEKNREIEEALLKGQTLERKRVAAELHDNLSAKISAIRWRLEAIIPNFKTEKEQKVYDTSILTLAEVYTDVRLIAHNLLPDELETKGLKPALEKLISELNSLGKTQFQLNISEGISRFSKKIEYEVYSLILESSSNVLKHSKATNCSILIHKVENTLFLTIADNGIGFNENELKKGMGIDNLKSRVNSLRGKIQFVSNDGVNIKIEIPV